MSEVCYRNIRTSFVIDSLTDVETHGLQIIYYVFLYFSPIIIIFFSMNHLFAVSKKKFDDICLLFFLFSLCSILILLHSEVILICRKITSFIAFVIFGDFDSY